MNVLTGVGILLLSMLIIGFLQLAPGIFLIFLHYASAKYSRKKVSDLSLSYIIGVEVIIAITFILLYTIAMASSAFLPQVAYNVFNWILVSIMIVIGIIFPICYFRKGSGTKLFISRYLAKKITASVKSVKTRSDAFVLGLVSIVPELVFTIPLFLVSIMMIMEIGETAISRSFIVLLFMLVAVVPLLIIRVMFGRDYNLANLQKMREKNKTFLSFFIGVLYLLIAALLILRIYG